MGRECNMNGGEDISTLYRVWVREPEGKRALGRLRRQRVDNIKTDDREIRRISGGLSVGIVRSRTKATELVS
jgi:hypothetical protein